MPSNHHILCHPLLLLPSIFSIIRVFSNESALHIRWAKYWSFSFNISSSNENPGLISFRMDWLDLLAVQGTLKSLLQHHSSKASILRRSAFFTVQLSHQYMTTGKTIALTRQTFVGKVMSLLLNMLSMLVITFLPRSKCLLISWLQSPSAVILEPRKIKSRGSNQSQTLGWKWGCVYAKRTGERTQWYAKDGRVLKMTWTLNVLLTHTSWQIHGETGNGGWLCFLGLTLFWGVVANRYDWVTELTHTEIH